MILTADVAEICAKIFVIFERAIDGDTEFERIDGTLNFVHRLDKKMRRHEIFSREKFFLLSSQFLKGLKLVGIEIVADALPTVNALQNIFLIGREV